MWSIQTEWSELEKFWLRYNEKEFIIHKDNLSYKSEDKNIKIEQISEFSFSATYEDKTCFFTDHSSIKKAHGKCGVNCVDITENGEEIISGAKDGTFFLTYKDTDPVPFEGPSKGFDVCDCMFIPEKKLIGCSCADFQIYLYNHTEYSYHGKLSGHKSSVNGLTYTNNLLFSCSDDGSVKSWDLEKLEQCGTVSFLASPITNIYSYDNHVYIASDSLLISFDSRTDQKGPGFIGKSIKPPYTAISANDKMLYAGSIDGYFAVWDKRNNVEPLVEWSWYDSSINKIRQDSDDIWVVTSEGIAAVVDYENLSFKRLLNTPPYEPIRDIRFSADKIVISCDNGDICLYEKNIKK